VTLIANVGMLSGVCGFCDLKTGAEVRRLWLQQPSVMWVLALAVHFLPTRWRGLRHSLLMGTTKWFRRAINRFAALRRWVQKLAAHTMKHDSTL